jgi:hypothetical protein
VSEAGSTPSVAAAVPVAPALTPEQLHELDEARRRWRKVQRAVGVARFSAWSLAVFGVGGLLMGLFDTTAAVVGLLITAVAVVEFRGMALLRRAQVKGPMLLGWNQMMLLGLIGGYCFYRVFIAEPPPLVSDPQLRELLSDPSARQALQDYGVNPGLFQMVDDPKTTNTLFYTLVALGSLVAQGLVALYYFSRVRVVAAYLRATPAWVVEVQRRAA